MKSRPINFRVACVVLFCLTLAAAPATAEVKPPVEPPPEKAAFDGAYYISKAWQYLDANDFEKAAEFFIFAAEFSEIKQEAALGLSYALRKTGKSSEAAAILAGLVEEGYKLDDTLPDLLGMLIAKGDYKKARRYVKKAGGKERSKWTKKIERGELASALDSALESGDASRLAVILRNNEKLLRSCVLPWRFFGAAKVVEEAGRPDETKDEATAAMEGLLKGCTGMWDLRIAVFHAIRPHTTTGEMTAIVEAEAARRPLSPKYREALAALTLSIKREAMAAADPSSPESIAAAREILALAPGDEGALVTLGWGAFNAALFDEAEWAFKELRRIKPGSKDYALGLAYTFLKTDREDEALLLADEMALAELKLDLLKRSLLKAGVESPEAKGLAGEILTIDSTDETALVMLGWVYLREKEFEKARGVFSMLLSIGGEEADGEEAGEEGAGYALGLAYSLIELDRREEARELKDRYGLEEITEGSLPVLEDALTIITREGGEAVVDESPAETIERARRILADDPGDEGGAAALAWGLFNAGLYGEALDAFVVLRRMDPENVDYAGGAAYTLMKLGRTGEAMAVAKEAGLVDLKIDLMKSALATLDAVSDEASEMARAILAERPGDEGAQSVLGWGYFNREDYDEALRIFSELRSSHPDNSDYGLGYAFSLMKLGRVDEALAVAETFSAGRETGSDFDSIRTEAYLARANEAYEDKDYDGAEVWLNKVLHIDGENASALSLFVWIRFNTGRTKEVVPYFVDEFERKGDAQSAALLLTAYDRAGMKREGEGFARSIASAEDDALRKAAAAYYKGKGWYSLAAAADNCPDECYYNAHKPRLDLGLSYWHKSGSEGTSLLDVTTLDFSYLRPLDGGREVFFRIMTEHLDSGTARASPFAGSFYKGAPPSRALTTDLWVTTPRVGVEKEGGRGYSLSLGVTPMGGPVSSTFTGELKVGPGPWVVVIDRQPVRESILSYVGLDDPYGDDSWGRVVRSGVEVEFNPTPAPRWWLSMKGGYDSYGGEDVIDNRAVHADLSFGKSSHTGGGVERSLGIFISAKHFQRNSNLYTYGHGGYFSPSEFLVAGPSIRYRTVGCARFLGDLQASVSYLYFKTERSKRYPLSDDPAAVGVWAEGESFSGVGYGVRGEGLWLLTTDWAGGVEGSLDKSADYTEWRAGLTLRYFFGGVKVLR